MLDPNGPDGAPLPLFESGAILIYLADRTGTLMPADAAGRYQTIQWLMFQIGSIGPMFGQLGFFHKFAGKDYEDKRPRDRYVAESQRLLQVLDQRLEGRAWMMGDDYETARLYGVLDRQLADREFIIGDDYTIADIAIFPWVRSLVGFYGAGEMVGYDAFKNVQRVLEAFLARPAVQRGLTIPS
jgi:GST-like protein